MHISQCNRPCSLGLPSPLTVCGPRCLSLGSSVLSCLQGGRGLPAAGRVPGPERSRCCLCSHNRGSLRGEQEGWGSFQIHFHLQKISGETPASTTPLLLRSQGPSEIPCPTLHCTEGGRGCSPRLRIAHFNVFGFARSSIAFFISLRETAPTTCPKDVTKTRCRFSSSNRL